MQQGQIALQLYTVRADTANDFLGTLRRLAALGYRAVEFAGYGGVPVGELRAALDEYGLQAIGAHVPYDDFAARLPAVLAELRTLGCAHAVVPSFPNTRRDDAEFVRAVAATFNRWGAACRAEGLRFDYHNHRFEFAPLAPGGGTLFDILATATDQALVNLEIDIAWAHVAGVDPVDLLRRHAGRVPLIHVKDLAPGEGVVDVPVGDGVLPWPRILEAAEAAGTRWYIVEQDHPRDPLADAERSLHNLAGLAAG
ncbi:MAG TPA: sugar phosphate isomerase/epimerase [Thermomicrobiales bacterium]|nr:sugar phosphate isomerase/epimerase [Thermomicrobiales bacterium]